MHQLVGYWDQRSVGPVPWLSVPSKYGLDRATVKECSQRVQSLVQFLRRVANVQAASRSF